MAAAMIVPPLPADIWSMILFDHVLALFGDGAATSDGAAAPLAETPLGALFRRMAPVCRLFRRLCWRRIATLPACDAPILDYVARTGIADCFRTLCLVEAADERGRLRSESADAYFAALPSLQCLAIRTPPPPRALLASLAAQSRLTGLDVDIRSWCKFPPIAAWLLPLAPQLRSLRLQNNRLRSRFRFSQGKRMPPLFAPAALPVLSALERLHVDVECWADLFAGHQDVFVTRAPDTAVPLPVDAWPHLVDLRLSVRFGSASEVCEREVCAMIDRAAPRLRCLALSFAIQHTDVFQAALCAAVSRCAGLEDLTLGGTNLVAAFLRDGARYCPPRLERLRLDRVSCKFLLGSGLASTASPSKGTPLTAVLQHLRAGIAWPVTLRTIDLSTETNHAGDVFQYRVDFRPAAGAATANVRFLARGKSANCLARSGVYRLSALAKAFNLNRPKAARRSVEINEPIKKRRIVVLT